MKQSQRVSSTTRAASLGVSILAGGRWLVRELPRRFVVAFRNRRTAIVFVTIAMVAFTSLAVFAATSEATLLRFDRAVQGRLLDSRTEWLNHAMIWLTFLGTRYVIAVAALGLLIWSRVNRKHQTFVMVIVAAAILNPVLEIGLKELVDRVRPAIDQLLPGNGPSFPSGHVLAAVGFYGLFPFLTWEATHKTWVRFVALLGSLAVVAVVTVSRPYLDVHWATDAIAGALLGMVLVVASYQVYLRVAEGKQASAV